MQRGTFGIENHEKFIRHRGIEKFDNDNLRICGLQEIKQDDAEDEINNESFHFKKESLFKRNEANSRRELNINLTD
jgi:hypothetical protein